MFDSVAGGYLPITFLAVVAGVLIARVRRDLTAAILAVVTPVFISYVWFWFPALVGLRVASESERGWDLVATAMWSRAAIPFGLVAFLLARLFWFKRVREA